MSRVVNGCVGACRRPQCVTQFRRVQRADFGRWVEVEVRYCADCWAQRLRDTGANPADPQLNESVAEWRARWADVMGPDLDTHPPSRVDPVTELLGKLADRGVDGITREEIQRVIAASTRRREVSRPGYLRGRT